MLLVIGLAGVAVELGFEVVEAVLEIGVGAEATDERKNHVGSTEPVSVTLGAGEELTDRADGVVGESGQLAGDGPYPLTSTQGDQAGEVSVGHPSADRARGASCDLTGLWVRHARGQALDDELVLRGATVVGLARIRGDISHVQSIFLLWRHGGACSSLCGFSPGVDRGR